MTALRDAYELIRDPQRWTAHTAARDGNGEAVYPESDSAVTWCASGALERCGAVKSHILLDALVSQLFPDARTLPFDCIVTVNDQLGHAAVMQVFEKALVETEGGL